MKILLSVEILIDKIATEETAFLINTLTANGHDVFVVANSNRLDVHDLFELYKNLRSCLPALPQKHILAAKDIHRIPGDIVVSIAPDDFDMKRKLNILLAPKPIQDKIKKGLRVEYARDFYSIYAQIGVFEVERKMEEIDIAAKKKLKKKHR